VLWGGLLNLPAPPKGAPSVVVTDGRVSNLVLKQSLITGSTTLLGKVNNCLPVRKLFLSSNLNLWSSK